VQQQQHHGKVLVLGSGMSGLAAAKVLSKYFSSVTLLDKDVVSSVPTDEAAKEIAKVGQMQWYAQQSLQLQHVKWTDPRSICMDCWYHPRLSCSNAAVPLQCLPWLCAVLAQSKGVRRGVTQVSGRGC
jgi:hypothetical protein